MQKKQQTIKGGLIMNRKHILVALTAVVIGFTAPLTAEARRETVIRESNGDRTVVRTDRDGTRVNRDGRDVYTSGGNRHRDQVEYSLRQGGRVVSDRSDKK